MIQVRKKGDCMSVLLGLFSLVILCIVVLLAASFPINEFTQTHKIEINEQLSKERFGYLFEVYKDNRMNVPKRTQPSKPFTESNWY